MTLLSRTGHALRTALRAPVTALLCGLLLLGLTTAWGMSAASATGSQWTIDGSYAFNGNGWTGTLAVTGAESGWPGVTMTYDERGVTEYLTGTWNPLTGTLTIYRPLQGGATQSYTLYLGDHVPGSPVFGGYFTESDTGAMRYGAFADDYLPAHTVRTAARPLHAAAGLAPAPGSPTTIIKARPDTGAPLDPIGGYYGFDGNGWDGHLVVWPSLCATPDTQVQMEYTELGRAEDIAAPVWVPSTGTLTLVRALGGGVTQTYTLYLGNHRPDDLVFGGYFTQSDVPGMRYAAYAYHLPGGVGC